MGTITMQTAKTAEKKIMNITLGGTGNAVIDWGDKSPFRFLPAYFSAFF